MKYNCANEFDLETIYKKLTSGHKVSMVKANNFFTREDDLEILQKRMNKLMSLKRAKASNRYIR